MQYTHMCQAQQLLSADNLLRIQVEALEEVLVHLPVAQTSLDLQKRAERVEEVEDERSFGGESAAAATTPPPTLLSPTTAAATAILQQPVLRVA